MANYVPNARQQFCDANGKPLAAGTVGMYVVGTLTPANTWQDSAQTTLNTNPILLDSGGFATIYGAGSYRQIVKDALGNTVYDRVVSGSVSNYDLAATTGAALIGSANGGTVQNYISNPGSGGPITATFAAPAFTNSAFASSVQHLTNGATPGSWYNSTFAGNYATEGLTAGITIPSSATNLQTNGVGVYVKSQRAQPGGIGGDVGGFFYVTSAANNCAVFGANLVLNDTVGYTGQTLTNELDFNVTVPATTVNGLNLVMVSTTAATLTGNRNAILVQGAFHATSTWSNGLWTTDGAIDLYAVFVGAVSSTSSTNRNSQPIGFVSYAADNTRYIATIRSDYTGGIDIRPGLATGAVAFQAPDGTNWGYVSANGFTLPERASGSVVTPPSGYQTLFIDTADHKVKRKDSSGTVTILA